jgi:hypothetical protein
VETFLDLLPFRRNTLPWELRGYIRKKARGLGDSYREVDLVGQWAEASHDQRASYWMPHFAERINRSMGGSAQIYEATADEMRLMKEEGRLAMTTDEISGRLPPEEGQKRSRRPGVVVHPDLATYDSPIPALEALVRAYASDLRAVIATYNSDPDTLTRIDDPWMARIADTPGASEEASKVYMQAFAKGAKISPQSLRNQLSDLEQYHTGPPSANLNG